MAPNQGGQSLSSATMITVAAIVVLEANSISNCPRNLVSRASTTHRNEIKNPGAASAMACSE
ncbi:hypothetical protein, partial [Burkholderia thailandensis]|uniref:hypothetical protein n=1 Tax=Burkholderia thailandensis TaxID=57975 RepID=UPI00217CDD78